MKKRLLKIMSIVALVGITLIGCGSDSVDNTEQTEVKKEDVSEDYFEWDGNIIIGLNDKGKKQKELVIPEKCEGFNCMLLNGEDVKVKKVSFESDKDITLNDALSSSDNLEELVLPKGLTEISSFEFYMCPNLKEIVIPEGVSVIGEYAFQNDESLEKVVFSGNTTTIEMNAFIGCNALKTVELSETMSVIKEYAFYGCESLGEIRFPSTISEIGAMAFMNSGVADVYFPAEVELSSIDTTSFVQVSHSVTIHVSEGSWMDANFDRLFEGPYVKSFE